VARHGGGDNFVIGVADQRAAFIGDCMHADISVGVVRKPPKMQYENHGKHPEIKREQYTKSEGALQTGRPWTSAL
jgi:hypothetical protein